MKTYPSWLRIIPWRIWYDILVDYDGPRKMGAHFSIMKLSTFFVFWTQKFSTSLKVTAAKELEESRAENDKRPSRLGSCSKTEVENKARFGAVATGRRFFSPRRVSEPRWRKRTEMCCFLLEEFLLGLRLGGERSLKLRLWLVKETCRRSLDP